MKFKKLAENFQKRPFIELKEALALTEESEQQVKNQFYKWTKQGKLTRLRRGKYLLGELYRKYSSSVYYISNYLYRPSYVSLYTALQFHGIIPEAVYTVEAVTPRHGQKWENSEGTFKYYSIKQDRFFGYKEFSFEDGRAQNKFLMALPEKALLDIFYFNKGNWPLKRIKEMRFQELNNIDIKRLKKLAEKFDTPKIKKASDNFVKYIEEFKP